MQSSISTRKLSFPGAHKNVYRLKDFKTPQPNLLLVVVEKLKKPGNSGNRICKSVVKFMF